MLCSQVHGAQRHLFEAKMPCESVSHLEKEKAFNCSLTAEAFHMFSLLQ